jgi:2'-5' RNA ligase
MASPENILLHLAEDEEQQVREIFARLAERGFPKQQQRPHITITFAPVMDDNVVQRAAQLLSPLIPATFRREGTVVFGRKRKQTVAWLLETSDELEIAAREISALNPHGRGPRWIPHLTVGLRLSRDIIPQYIRALDELVAGKLRELTAVRAAHWRPHAQQRTVLAGADPHDLADLSGLRERGG